MKSGVILFTHTILVCIFTTIGIRTKFEPFPTVEMLCGTQVSDLHFNYILRRKQTDI